MTESITVSTTDTTRKVVDGDCHLRGCPSSCRTAQAFAVGAWAAL